MKLRLLREEKDREYRKREKEAALRRKQMDEKLFTDRGAQVDEMKRQRERQLLEEKEIHRQVLERLQEEEEKERIVIEREKGKKYDYRKGKFMSHFLIPSTQKFSFYFSWNTEILKQINEKSAKSKEMKQQIRNEFNLDQQKEEMRKKNLELVINEKIKAMRRANIPENMIKDVERQIKAGENVKFRAMIK